MAHHARTHPTLNQRLSGKENPPQISVAITLSRRRAAFLVCICLASLSTLSPGRHSSVSPGSCRSGMDREGCSPPRYSPSSVYPQNSRNIWSPGIAGDPPIFWLKAPRPCSSEWKLEPAAPSPRKLNFTKPQISHLVTLSWINKNSWAFLVSHGKADLWTNHKPCLSL